MPIQNSHPVNTYKTDAWWIIAGLDYSKDTEWEEPEKETKNELTETKPED